MNSKLYVLIGAVKHYILQVIVDKWGIQAGAFTVMGYPILSD